MVVSRGAVHGEAGVQRFGPSGQAVDVVAHLVVGQASGGLGGGLPAEVDLLSSGDELFVHFGEPVEGSAIWFNPLRL